MNHARGTLCWIETLDSKREEYAAIHRFAALLVGIVEGERSNSKRQPADICGRFGRASLRCTEPTAGLGRHSHFHQTYAGRVPRLPVFLGGHSSGDSLQAFGKVRIARQRHVPRRRGRKEQRRGGVRRERVAKPEAITGGE